jgi:L-aminopeptidase/D-esterase-like protein
VSSKAASRGAGRLTDVPGLKVGQAHDPEGITGCTAVLCEGGFTAAGDVRGGGPGTRETDL